MNNKYAPNKELYDVEYDPIVSASDDGWALLIDMHSEEAHRRSRFFYRLALISLFCADCHHTHEDPETELQSYVEHLEATHKNRALGQGLMPEDALKSADDIFNDVQS